MTKQVRTRVAMAALMTALTAGLLAGCADMQKDVSRDLTAGMTPPPQAAPQPGAVAALDRLSPSACNQSLARSLAGERIPIDNVRDLVYGVNRDDARGQIQNYNAWVYLKNQPGAVVVQMDANCTPQQVYTRDGATLPNRPG